MIVNEDGNGTGAGEDRADPGTEGCDPVEGNGNGNADGDGDGGGRHELVERLLKGRQEGAKAGLHQSGGLDQGIGLVKGSRDFYSLSGCRDLLFHVQEHLFTPRELEQCCESMQLDFLGFDNLTPATKQAYRNLFPADGSLTELSNWQSYESRYPRTFARMYGFWCQARDAGAQRAERARGARTAADETHPAVSVQY